MIKTKLELTKKLDKIWDSGEDLSKLIKRKDLKRATGQIEIRCKKCKGLLFLAFGDFEYIQIKCRKCKYISNIKRKDGIVFLIVEGFLSNSIVSKLIRKKEDKHVVNVYKGDFGIQK